MINLDGFNYTLDINRNGVVSLYRDDEFVNTLSSDVEIEELVGIIKNHHKCFLNERQDKFTELHHMEREVNRLREELGLEEIEETPSEDVLPTTKISLKGRRGRKCTRIQSNEETAEPNMYELFGSANRLEPQNVINWQEHEEEAEEEFDEGDNDVPM